MAKRRGNPNWGKPEPIGPVVPTVTSFEQVVKEFKLTPDQYVRSTRLREWARRNKNSKYIPEALLEAWGFEIESAHCGEVFSTGLETPPLRAAFRWCRR